MNKIKKMLRMLMIIILILCGIIGFILSKQKDNITSEENRISDESTPIAEEVKRSSINERDECFIVMECVKKYEQVLLSSSSQEKINKLYNMTSKEFMEEYNISKNNIMDELMVSSITEEMNIKDIINNEEENKYFVYTYVEIDNEPRELYLLVFLDEKNNTFAVAQDEKLAFFEDVDYVVENIAKNDDNQYEPRQVSDAEMAIYYFNDFANKLKSDDLYMAYEALDEEFSDNQFGNLTNFENYVNKNKENIKGLQLVEYKIENDSGKTKYICKGSDEKYYIFEPKSVLKYSVYISDKI